MSLTFARLRNTYALSGNSSLVKQDSILSGYVSKYEGNAGRLDRLMIIKLISSTFPKAQSETFQDQPYYVGLERRTSQMEEGP